MAHIYAARCKSGYGYLGCGTAESLGSLKRIVFEADLQTTKASEGMVEAKPMKRYISLIEENGTWHI